MAKKGKIKESDLRHWKVLEVFLEALAPVISKARRHPTFADPRRQLDDVTYLALFLFSLFNPVVESLRGLCALTGLKKAQKRFGCGPISLGSLSEIQHVIDPDLLKRVFENLSEQVQPGHKNDPRLRHLELIAQDGSLWSALPRMAWAEYGVGRHGNSNGVRLHLRFNILKDCPVDAQVSPGKACEARALREMLVPGQTNVGDRYYGQDYRLFEQIDHARAFFVFRINDRAVVHWEEELELSQADRAAGVVRHGWVRLGRTDKVRTGRLRLVEVKREGGRNLLLLTNHTAEAVPAELVSLIYRRRWSIELFFHWIKCIFGCRHFLAESENGVALEIYLALIASLILRIGIGHRPNKRTMELIRYYLMGWAEAEEVVALSQKYAARGKSQQKSSSL